MMQSEPKDFIYPEQLRDACAYYLLELCLHSQNYYWGLSKNGPPEWLLDIWGERE